MLLFSTHITPRLRYIVDFVGSELFDEPIQITTDIKTFAAAAGPRINYSDQYIAGCFFIRPIPLLFESGVRAIEIECFPFRDQKAFFATQGDFPFDLFSAAFYLLTRYEEYLPHDKDEYGRYAHTNSLAWREGFLDQPLVNGWLQEFKTVLSLY